MNFKSIVLSLLLIVSIATCTYAQPRCPPGTFNRQTGRVPCFACPLSTFQQNPGKKRCRRCPVGKSTVLPWTRFKTSCTSCPNNEPTCTFCRPGYYAPGGVKPAGGSCTACDPWFASAGGVSECSYCDYRLGYITAGSAAPECMQCPLGHKANRGDFCVKNSCSADDRNAPLSCRLCQPGSNSSTGYEPCDLCPRGAFSDRFGATSCMACKYDTTTSSSGARSMGACEKSGGSGTLETRAPSPTPSFTPVTISVCVAGFEAQNGNCIACSPGSFKPFGGSESCTLCPKNQFATGSGATACQRCPTGEITSGEGASSCFPCPNEGRQLVTAN